MIYDKLLRAAFFDVIITLLLSFTVFFAYYNKLSNQYLLIYLIYCIYLYIYFCQYRYPPPPL